LIFLDLIVLVPGLKKENAATGPGSPLTRLAARSARGASTATFNPPRRMHNGCACVEEEDGGEKNSPPSSLVAA